MAVETAPFIGTLDSNLPAAGDPVSEGYQHFQVTKGACISSFPNFNSTVWTNGTFAQQQGLQNTHGAEIDYFFTVENVERIRSVFGRTDVDILAVAGDYNIDQIDDVGFSQNEVPVGERNFLSNGEQTFIEDIRTVDGAEVAITTDSIGVFEDVDMTTPPTPTNDMLLWNNVAQAYEPYSLQAAVDEKTQWLPYHASGVSTIVGDRFRFTDESLDEVNPSGICTITNDGSNGGRGWEIVANEDCTVIISSLRYRNEWYSIGGGDMYQSGQGYVLAGFKCQQYVGITDDRTTTAWAAGTKFYDQSLAAFYQYGGKGELIYKIPSDTTDGNWVLEPNLSHALVMSAGECIAVQVLGDVASNPANNGKPAQYFVNFTPVETGERDAAITLMVRRN